jgi:hypothetical protein
LSIFVVITLVFGFLQWRVAAIGTAVDRRTRALQKLRRIKAMELSGDLLNVDYAYSKELNLSNNNDDDDDATVIDNYYRNQVAEKNNARVATATEDYREAVQEVERLRTIIPGFARIAPPPAPTAVMEENIAAAKQFLGIDLSESSRSSLLPPGPRGENRAADEADAKTKRRNESDESPLLSSPVLIAVLVAVGISQIGLLFLLSLDPMMPSSSNVFIP